MRVVERAAERAAHEVDDIPWHLTPPPGQVHVQLRTTLHRVGVGAGLARRPELIQAVRAIEGMPGLVTSSSGGTFTMGGPGWLGLAAIGTPPPATPFPLDWMATALRVWFAAWLGPLGVASAMGRIEGAWCPGFSDLAAGGRKLAGLGFRISRGVVAMRGVMPVTPIGADDFGILAACHLLINVPISRTAATSLVEASGDSSWTTPRIIEHLTAGA